jgi:hypothetical protein
MWLVSPQLLILAAAMALSTTAGWWMTANHYQNRIAQHEVQVERLNSALLVAGLELSGAISERNAARHEKMNKSWEVVYVEVVKYPDGPQKPAADGFCYIDGDWVRLHDAAADLSSPPAPTGTVESTTYARALETITRNYREYNKCRAQVIGLIEIYEGARKLCAE